MLTSQVATYLRSIIQEPDATFLTDAILATWLQQGYRQFRTLVEKHRSDFYAVSVDITPAGRSYDLGLAANAVRVLGSSTLTHQRVKRIISVQTTTDTGIANVWRGVSSLRALQTGFYTSARQYFLQGTVLHFDTELTDTVTIVYSPVDNIAWAANLTGAGVFIDDLDDFHDVIGLFAAQHYHIADVSTNPRLDIQTAARLEELAEYMAQQREDDDAYVSREDD